MGSRADNVSPVSVLIEPMSHDQPLTKEAILDAAEQTLRRYGPDKTSVVDVAKALQVSHGSLYRHFPSKAALRAVTERWLQRIADPLQKIADGTEAAPPSLAVMDGYPHPGQTGLCPRGSEMFAMYTTVTLEAVKVIDTHVKLLIGQVAQIIDRGCLLVNLSRASQVGGKAFSWQRPVSSSGACFSSGPRRRLKPILTRCGPYCYPESRNSKRARIIVRGN